MGKQQFIEYLRENFSLSPEAHRIIRNILDYVVEQDFADKNQQTEVLSRLLAGIGLQEDELMAIDFEKEAV